MLVIEGKVKRKKICRRLKQIDDEGRSQETEKRMRKEQKPGNAENTTAVEVILENITKRKVEKGDQKKTAKKKVRDGGRNSSRSEERLKNVRNCITVEVILETQQNKRLKESKKKR